MYARPPSARSAAGSSATPSPHVDQHDSIALSYDNLYLAVLQNSQNRDGKVLHVKLDELILSSRASNKFVGAEKLNEDELWEMSEKLKEDAEDLEEADDKAEDRKFRRPSGVARPA